MLRNTENFRANTTTRSHRKCCKRQRPCPSLSAFDSAALQSCRLRRRTCFSPCTVRSERFARGRRWPETKARGWEGLFASLVHREVNRDGHAFGYSVHRSGKQFDPVTGQKRGVLQGGGAGSESIESR